jgi:hypothetical protein
MQDYQKLTLPQSLAQSMRDNPREFFYQIAILAVIAIVLGGICGL